MEDVMDLAVDDMKLKRKIYNKAGKEIIGDGKYHLNDKVDATLSEYIQNSSGSCRGGGAWYRSGAKAHSRGTSWHPFEVLPGSP